MLLEKIKEYKIILGSGSPRRKELVEGLGLNYTIEYNENVDENYDSSLPLLEIPEYLARKKSLSFSRPLEDKEILITADTMVLCGEEILGKPIDKEDAAKMLQKLSGKMHQVLTGVTLRTMCKEISFTDTTNVYFRELKNKEIEYYIDNYAPYDKAGAYGAQEWIGYVAISKIEGSYFNVMGLPINRLYLEIDAILSL